MHFELIFQKIRRWIKFNLSYLGKPPWDTGISPPELWEFIRQHTPGDALDLGCGTGTNVITLVKSGWNAVGVDFGFLAVLIANQRIKKYGKHAEIRYGDVTNLDVVGGTYDLILDIGCFHSLIPEQKALYIQNLDHLLLPSGYLLMYGHKMVENANMGGITEQNIREIQEKLNLVKREDSIERKQRPATWLTFQSEKAD